MEVKVKLSDLNDIMQRNAQLNTLLADAEITLARMQSRLPDDKKYDHDAQNCANMRGSISEFLKESSKQTNSDNTSRLDPHTIQELCRCFRACLRRHNEPLMNEHSSLSQKQQHNVFCLAFRKSHQGSNRNNCTYGECLIPEEQGPKFCQFLSPEGVKYLLELYSVPLSERF